MRRVIGRRRGRRRSWPDAVDTLGTMVSPVDALTPKVQAALRAAVGEQYAGVDPVIRPSQFADLQVNVALDRKSVV